MGSKPSKFGERHIRFCPKCGVEKLERDWFIGAPHLAGKKQPKAGVEYVCGACGFAFWISKSRRLLFAEQMHKQARERAPVKFTEKCVGTEIADAYLRSVDPPVLGQLKRKVLEKLKGLVNGPGGHQ